MSFDVESFACSVKGYTPTIDGSSVQYHIHLKYGTTAWDLKKRFSDFDLLLIQLSDSGFAAIPSLPEKTFLGAPSDCETIATRQKQLEVILHSLLSRPDVRSSTTMRQFLQLDSHTTVTPGVMQPVLVRGLEDLRFSISDFDFNIESGLLIIAQEDATALSRLGRVWSVVEPDELGSMHVWYKSPEKSWERLYSETFPLKARCCSISSKPVLRIFVGMEDGTVRVYTRSTDPNVEPNASIQLVGELDLHHKSPVTWLSADATRLMSLGFDTAMRIINLEDLSVFCGGRLAKRLGESYITSGCFFNDLAVLGTSSEDLFIYYIACNPPTFRSQAKAMGGPVHEIIKFGNNLLVAHGDRISLYHGPDNNVGQLVRSREFRTAHLLAPEHNLITCDGSDSLIIGGFDCGTVVGWSIDQQNPLFAIRTHEEGCARIRWLPRPWGPAFVTGGHDGKVLTWSMPVDITEYKVWSPASVPIEGTKSPGVVVVGQASHLPNVYGAVTNIDEKRQEPQLISTYTHHNGDSDDDDELTGIF